jgi:hypothetical protein
MRRNGKGHGQKGHRCGVHRKRREQHGAGAVLAMVRCDCTFFLMTTIPAKASLPSPIERTIVNAQLGPREVHVPGVSSFRYRPKRRN